MIIQRNIQYRFPLSGNLDLIWLAIGELKGYIYNFHCVLA